MRIHLSKRISEPNTSYFFFIQRILLIIFLAILQVHIISWMETELSIPNASEISLTSPMFRRMDMSIVDEDVLIHLAEQSNVNADELLTCALLGGIEMSKDMSKAEINHLIRFQNQLARKCPEYEMMVQYIQGIQQDMIYFPVAKSLYKDYDVEFVDSWGAERTFGGKRGHEGCDLMATKQRSGLYPIVSVSDGVVTNKGWLEKGGWRIGVMSDSGIYYYYAHLSEYADLEIGDEVHAGDLLGFMGDSGYGPEGTVGMFDVHLHFGIYLYDSKGNEISVNPYGWILLKKNKVLYFDY